MKGRGIRGAIEEGCGHMSCGLMSLALQTLVDGWCEPLLKMCEDYLSSVVLCTPGRREVLNRGEGEDEGGRGKERTIGGGEEEVGREGSKLCCLSFCTESDSQESTLNEKEMIRHLFILGY